MKKEYLYTSRLTFRHMNLSNSLEYPFRKFKKIRQKRENGFSQICAISMKTIGNDTFLQPAPNPFGQF